jgi:hypothetical protein
MRYGYVVIGLLTIFAGVTPAPGADFGPRWSFSTSVNYSVGDYGTGSDTTIVYVPFTLGVRPIERLSISLTVPYIYLSSDDVVVTGGGVAVKKRENGTATTSRRSTSEGGLGDILLKGSFIVLEERAWLPEIAPYLKTKFPTADEDRGLGTGEFDETIGVDLSKQVMERLFGYLTLAYTFIGDPPGTNLRNTFGWSVGAAYAVTTRFPLFAFLDGATAITPGQSDPVELRVGAEYRLARALKLTGSVTRGLTDGAADWGLGAGLTLRF